MKTLCQTWVGRPSDGTLVRCDKPGDHPGICEGTKVDGTRVALFPYEIHPDARRAYFGPVRVIHEGPVVSGEFPQEPPVMQQVVTKRHTKLTFTLRGFEVQEADELPAGTNAKDYDGEYLRPASDYFVAKACDVCGANPRTHACDEEACEPKTGEEP